MRTLLGLIASLGLVACVGGIEPPSGGDDDGGVGGGGTGPEAIEAKRLFDTTVYPILSRSLAGATQCIACHNVNGPVGNITGFVDPDKAKAYQTATGFQALVGALTPTAAPILTKISASHEGQIYSTDDVTKITAWLNKELEARAGGGGGTPSPTGESPGALTERLMKEWSGCMTLDNFKTAQMTNWGNINAGGGGNCKTCHGLGEYGEIASNAESPFFDYISQDKYYMLQYFSVDLAGGAGVAKVIINTRSFTGVGTGLPGHESHPRFDPTNNAGMVALQKFYDSTNTAKAAAPAGVCGPPKLTN